MNTPSLKGQVHEEIEKIFRTLLPRNGLAVREEQVTLCHIMLDALLKNNIALCDAGVGIGKTYAYLTGCILLRKNAPHSAVGSLPVVVSTSSIALQDAIIEEYIPFLSRIFLENHIIQKPIRAIVRKGKERFVCDVRLAQRLEAVKDKKKNIEQLEALLSLRTYHDLDAVTGLSGFDRRQVCVPKFCEKSCQQRSLCRYHQYLKEAKSAEISIQICNHNYLLADAAHRLQALHPLLNDYQALVIDEYEIIGLNLKSQLNQGFRGLVLFLLTLKIADKAIHRRQYAQNRNLSAERGAASLCSASTRHTLPTYISFRRSTELSACVDLHRVPLRHSTHVPVARAA